MTGGQKALDQTLAGCNNPGTSGDSQLQGREDHGEGRECGDIPSGAMLWALSFVRAEVVAHDAVMRAVREGALGRRARTALICIC